jgi:lysophospholipase L1-like esterase
MPAVRVLSTAIPLLMCALAPALGAEAAPAAAPPIGALQKAIERREQWRRTRVDVYMNDFGELGRYRKANTALKAPAAGENRVVFLGDSITDMWRLETSFPGKPYVNRGISGQTTAQLLLRFRQDVIDLKPKAVVILAGTNDIAGNTGPMSNEDIQANYANMVELCRAHGIAVVLASILPVHNYTPLSDLAFVQRPPERIVELNRWLKAQAASTGAIYLDYFSAMVDQKGWLKRDLAEDGLHPNGAGYAIMARLVSAALAKTLPAPLPSPAPR